jgi:fatty acid desaturase
MAPMTDPATSTPRRDTSAWFTRLWGLVLIVIGLWLFGRFTLDLDLPSIDWDLVWPLVLIAVGGFVLLSAAGRRR